MRKHAISIGDCCVCGQENLSGKDFFVKVGRKTKEYTADYHYTSEGSSWKQITEYQTLGEYHRFYCLDCLHKEQVKEEKSLFIASVVSLLILAFIFWLGMSILYEYKRDIIGMISFFYFGIDSVVFFMISHYYFRSETRHWEKILIYKHRIECEEIYGKDVVMWTGKEYRKLAPVFQSPFFR